jgi:chromosome partitioning protein
MLSNLQGYLWKISLGFNLKIIGIANSKGGSGKTILAINLSVEACDAGFKVCLIDCDPQASASKWAKKRDLPRPIVMPCSLRELPAALAKAEKNGFDIVFVDFAGRDDAGLTAVSHLFSLFLVPAAPFEIELQETKVMRKMISAAGGSSRIVLVRTTGQNAARSQNTMGQYPEYFTPVSTRSLVAFPDAYAMGRGVREAFPNSPAVGQLRALFEYVLHFEEREK